MTTDNNLNNEKGRLFQKKVAEMLSDHFGTKFEFDHPIQIGDPKKEHRFDLVSADLHYVGECKNYSWTESGNVPSAKMGFVNEAVFYLSFLPREVVRFIAMRKDVHPKRHETVAEYYYRTYRHLLNGVYIIEIDIDNEVSKEIGHDLTKKDNTLGLTTEIVAHELFRRGKRTVDEASLREVLYDLKKEDIKK